MRLRDEQLVVKTRVYPEFAKVSFLVYGLIGTIAIFFVGAIIAYLSRYFFSDQPVGAVQVPRLLWINTGILLAGSHLLFRAYRAIRLERRKQFLTMLTTSLVFAVIFCVLQVLGLFDLLNQHFEQPVATMGSAAAMLFMAFLHIAHFLAGLIGLSYVTYQAYAGRYDHEFNNGVRLAAIYWRFLDIIWIVLLVLFVLTRT